MPQGFEVVGAPWLLGPGSLPHSHSGGKRALGARGWFYKPVLPIVHITFAHIPLLRTQWSPLIARETGEYSLSVGPGGRIQPRYHGAWILEPNFLGLNPSCALDSNYLPLKPSVSLPIEI